jgi:hypothetical protein
MLKGLNFYVVGEETGQLRVTVAWWQTPCIWQMGTN